MKDIVLETRGLTHIYSRSTPFEHKAIDDVSIAIERGQLVGIIGHTGSGKSTLIQHFNGILKPDVGTVLLNGKDIWADKSEIRKVRFQVGVCFQYPEYQLFEETVYKDIAFGPKNMGLTQNEIDKRVHEVIRFIGLDDSFLKKSPFDLSGGEKRKVAIAGVMAMKPEVLVLDEPCAGLDPKGRDTLLDLIAAYRKQTGSTVIFVSHSMEDIAKIASYILVFRNARCVLNGTVREVFSQAEVLREIGLDIPAVTQILLQLKENGLPVDTGIYDVTKASEEIVRALRGNSAC